ncbi:MAG TPA: hypothetical protein VF261_02795 [Candidatus Saccharimonadales bacterium]
MPKITTHTIHTCPECGLHYTDKALAQKCKAWCRQHRSCNLEIAKLSVEVQERT